MERIDVSVVGEDNERASDPKRHAEITGPRLCFRKHARFDKRNRPDASDAPERDKPEDESVA